MHALHKYRRSYTIGMQSGLEYRADFFLSLFSAVFPIFIQLFMWMAIYGQSDTNVIFGYTHSQMIIYSVMAAVLSRLLRTGFEYDISNDIKSGGLSKFIIRPIAHMPYRFMHFLGIKTVQTGLISILAIAAAILLAVTTSLSVPMLQFLMFLPAFLMAYLMNFMLFYGVSAVAFWLTEIGFFFEAVRIVFIALSGGIFPLSVLGSQTEKVLNWLPFRYTINFPIDVLNGRIAGDDTWKGLLVQLLWILILYGLAKALWHRGTKKYIAAGG